MIVCSTRLLYAGPTGIESRGGMEYPEQSFNRFLSLVSHFSTPGCSTYEPVHYRTSIGS